MIKPKLSICSILAICACAVLVSCAKETASPANEGGSPAKITMNFNVGSRAVTETDTDCSINDIVFFVFKADGTIDIPPVYTTSAEMRPGSPMTSTTWSKTIPAHSTAVSIYAICNTRYRAKVEIDGSISGYETMWDPNGPKDPYKNITTLAQLKAITLPVFPDDMGGNPNYPCSIAGNNREGSVLMSGYDVLTDDGMDPDGVTRKKSANVQLMFLPAKLYITIENRMSTSTNPQSTQALAVALVNAPGWTRLVSAGGSQQFQPSRAQIPSGKPFFYSGIDISDYYDVATYPSLRSIPYADRPASGDYYVYNQNYGQIGARAYLDYGAYGNWVMTSLRRRPPEYFYNYFKDSYTAGGGGMMPGDTYVWNNHPDVHGIFPSYDKSYNAQGVLEDYECYNLHTAMYVYPGSFTEPNHNTYLTICGLYNSGDFSKAAKPNIFWPVAFDGTKLPVIQSGNKYYITITLKGNADFDGGGSDDPTVPPSSMTVQVAVTPWRVVTYNTDVH